MAAHIRKRLKVEGIKALCKMQSACGVKYISIAVPCADTTWTAEETAKIRHIADCNKLTGARKSPINMAAGYMAGVKYAQFSFEYHG
jgi:hypothetical protein